MQSENIDLTAASGDYDIARGTTAYFHIATVSTDFAAEIDTTATEAVQTQALAESCVITGNALRSGKAEVVGYVQPNKDGSNWVCGIVLTITEDAEAGDTLAFKVSDGALKGGNRFKLNVNVLVVSKIFIDFNRMLIYQMLLKQPLRKVILMKTKTMTRSFTLALLVRGLLLSKELKSLILMLRKKLRLLLLLLQIFQFTGVQRLSRSRQVQILC